MKTFVWCSMRFEGFHKWDMAPAEVGFLRHLHRHVFHVRVEKEVSQPDRQIEFIMLKREVQKLIAGWTATRMDEIRSWSCEMWAEHLLAALDASAVEVSEDGENGARVQA